MRAFLLVVFVSLCLLPCFSQSKSIQGKKVYSDFPVLNEQFKTWTVFHIPSEELKKRTQFQSNEIRVQLNLGNLHDWDLLLHPNDLRSNSYHTLSGTGEVFKKRKINLLQDMNFPI